MPDQTSRPSAIRPYRQDDDTDLARICIATADAGQDATGLLDDDEVWAELFVLPYVHRHPELAFVVESADGRPLGYIVGTDDTAAFEQWFGAEWWPRNRSRWPVPDAVTTRHQGLLAYGYSRGQATAASLPGYPAHLHIDLLPQAQGAGWGRILVEQLAMALHTRGVPGVHAAVSLDNSGALRFYPKIGFAPIAEDAYSRTFGLPLNDNRPPAELANRIRA